MILVFLVTVAARAVGNQRSYDVFVDEVSYWRISESVARDGAVDLYSHPFFLHPPAQFFLEAGWLRLFGLPTGVFDAVTVTRWLVFLLAGLTAVLAVRLGYLLAGQRAAVAVGVLFVLDPFLLRINSRNLLETPTLLWVLAGISVLAMPLATARPLTARRAIAGGVLLGLGVLSKDTAALAISLPLLYLFALRESRRPALIAACAVVVTYLPYPVVTALTGNWPAFLQQKRTGALRLSGSIQITGFHAAGAAPFPQRVLERLALFGASYVVMAVGVAAAAYLVLRCRPASRLLGWWLVGSYGLAAYAVLRGTLEEQLFYFVLLPAAVAVPVAGAEWWSSRQATTGAMRSRLVAVLLVVAFVAPATLSYVDIHTHRDDNYARMATYIREHLQGNGVPRLGVTGDTASVVIGDSQIYRVGSVAQARRSRVDYVLVSTNSLRDGTASVDRGLLALIDAGTVVHEVSGRSVGRLRLIRVTP